MAEASSYVPVSIEYKVLKKYFERLNDAVGDTGISIAGACLSADLISIETLQLATLNTATPTMRNGDLLKGILSAIVVDPESLMKFILILEKFPPLDIIAKEMKQDLESPQVNEVPSVPQHPQQQPQITRGRIDIDEEEIYEEYYKVRGELGKRVDEIKNEAESAKIETNNLRYFLIYTNAVHDGVASKLERANSLSEIFEVVCSDLCSPTNLTVLYDIANHYKLPDTLITALIMYEVDQEFFYLKLSGAKFAEILKKEIEVTGRDPEATKTTIKVKLRQEESRLTVLEFEKILKKVFHKLARYIHILKVEEGCVCVTLYAPKAVMGGLVVMGKRNISYLLDVGVILLIIGGKTIIKNMDEEEAEKEKTLLLTGIDPQVIDKEREINNLKQSNEKLRNELHQKDLELADCYKKMSLSEEVKKHKNHEFHSKAQQTEGSTMAASNSEASKEYKVLQKYFKQLNQVIGDTGIQIAGGCFSARLITRETLDLATLHSTTAYEKNYHLLNGILSAVHIGSKNLTKFFSILEDHPPLDTLAKEMKQYLDVYMEEFDKPNFSRLDSVQRDTTAEDATIKNDEKEMIYQASGLKNVKTTKDDEENDDKNKQGIPSNMIWRYIPPTTADVIIIGSFGYSQVHSKCPKIVPNGTPVKWMDDEIDCIVKLYKKVPDMYHLQPRCCDFPGAEHPKQHYLELIQRLFENSDKETVVIWYTGHGEKSTGNWCFKDGVITFQEIFDLYMKSCKRKRLYIISDCSYSGNWIKMCGEKLDDLGIPSCGHRTRQHGIFLAVFASCRADEEATVLTYINEGVEYNKVDGDTLHQRWKKTVFSRKEHESCEADETCTWEDRVFNKKHRVHLVCGEVGSGSAAWCYVFVDENKLGEFGLKVDTDKIRVADYGEVLYSGWGKTPPKDIQKKIDVRFKFVVSAVQAE